MNVISNYRHFFYSSLSKVGKLLLYMSNSTIIEMLDIIYSYQMRIDRIKRNRVLMGTVIIICCHCCKYVIMFLSRQPNCNNCCLFNPPHYLQSFFLGYSENLNKRTYCICTSVLKFSIAH